MKWLNIGKFKSSIALFRINAFESFEKPILSKFKQFKSKNDKDNDNPIKNLRSPPPQNPICHKTNPIIALKAVKSIEKMKINTLLVNRANDKLKINP